MFHSLQNSISGFSNSIARLRIWSSRRLVFGRVLRFGDIGVVEGEQAVFRAFAVVAVAEDTHADAPHQLVDRLHIGNGEVGGHAESAVLPVLKLMGRQHRETGAGEEQLLPPLFDGGFREPDHPLRFRQLEFQRFGLVRSEREKAFLIQHAPAVVVAGGDGKFDAALRLAAGIGDVYGQFRCAGVPQVERLPGRQHQRQRRLRSRAAASAPVAPRGVSWKTQEADCLPDSFFL